MTPASKELFTNLGISVEFNTLCMTRELIDSYIAETSDIVAAGKTQSSQYVKYACYSKFYDFIARPKMTGFEAFDDLTKTYKIEQGFLYTGPRDSGSIECDTPAGKLPKYKSVLKKQLKSINKPILLYLSGGLDSEFVARALLDAGKAFTPVMFTWLDADGQVANIAETQHAYAFCTKYNLTPITQIVEIPSLWKSDEFKQLTQDIQVVSPQLTTHAYMVKMMNDLEPGCMHLLGGEIRYVKKLSTTDDAEVNIVKLAKPPFVYTATVSGNNVNLNIGMLSSYGWDGIAPVIVSITASNVGSSSPYAPAMTYDTSGAPAGSSFTISGTIIGGGGTGGAGVAGGANPNGGGGGTGLAVSTNVAGVGLNVYGGGGGGGGGGVGNGNVFNIWNGGSGGGGGAGYGAGGPPGANTYMAGFYTGCTAGSAGSYAAGGAGGPGGSWGGIGADGFGYPGGNGGGPGAYGDAGQGWNNSGGAGGPPGAAIVYI